jgi:hypothetical protein
VKTFVIGELKFKVIWVESVFQLRGKQKQKIA